MNEIGGYLELEQFDGTPLYPDAIPLNTGRNALEYLIRSRKIQTLAVPIYLCDSVHEVCARNSVTVEYYHIDSAFHPILDDYVQEPSKFLYLVNYYGILTEEEICRLKAAYPNLILDQAQAFFQKMSFPIDTIYSCRKFFGVPDGAYLYTTAHLDEKLEVDASAERMVHILGRFEGAASNYYSYFRKVEDMFSDLPLKQMSPLTKNLMNAVNYKKIYEKRKNNFEVLNQAFKDKNLPIFQRTKGLYCYPLYVSNGLELRKRLQSEGIYIPTLWADVLENKNSSKIEQDFSANILPLPIDQRYNKEHMDQIIHLIENLF